MVSSNDSEWPLPGSSGIDLFAMAAMNAAHL
jgi:hypothetical protein